MRRRHVVFALRERGRLCLIGYADAGSCTARQLVDVPLQTFDLLFNRDDTPQLRNRESKGSRGELGNP